MNHQDNMTVTLPFSENWFWITVIIISILALSWLGFHIGGLRAGKKQLPKDWQMKSLRGFAGIMAPIWLALLVLTIWHLFDLWFTGPPEDNETANRLHYLALVGLMTVLGGLVGLPLALLRVLTTERQVTATEQGLITDRINKAVEGLGAEKTVKRLNEGGEPVELTEPNIEVRIGAIYSLERIAQDSDRDHIQIMEILCAYVRENAPAKNAQNSPLERYEIADDCGRTHSEIQRVAELSEEATTIDGVRIWARGISIPRSDIATTINVIGRRSQHQISLERNARKSFPNHGYRLDLSNTALQRANFGHGDFGLAYFNGAHLAGSNFLYTNLTLADFAYSRLEFSHFEYATLDRNGFSHARMEGASFQSEIKNGIRIGDPIRCDFLSAKMRWTVFSFVDLSSANFHQTFLREVYFNSVNFRPPMSGASFTPTDIWGAAFRNLELPKLNLIKGFGAFSEKFFADGSVTGLPEGSTWPSHWPKETINNFDDQWNAWKKKPHQ